LIIKDDRIEDFVLTKLDKTDKKMSKPNILETLGQTFADYGHDIGASTKYGIIYKKNLTQYSKLLRNI
jgi:hypothetical protein